MLQTYIQKSPTIYSYPGSMKEFNKSYLVAQEIKRLCKPEANNIGKQGRLGFGVALAPVLPSGYTALPGYDSPLQANYGNYQYADGSIQVWIPAFFYRIGHPDSPRYATYGANAIDILPVSAFATVAAANAAGYALHRVDYDDSAIKPGFFFDKYMCSNNGGIASSIKLGAPLSTASTHNPISGLTGAPPNNYAGTIAAAKTRGSQFFPASRFMYSALALLQLAHAQAATGTDACAWYDATGVTNYPKGNNNNALADVNDTSVTFTSDGYASGNSALTGSASNFAKTTHNGQLCGITDLNGNMWETSLGITSDGTNFYFLKTSTKMADITGGNTLATDAWGAAGLAALYDNVGATVGALLVTSSTVRYGNAAAQVFSAALVGQDWAMTGLGIPLAGGVSPGGSNLMGLDGLWDYRPTDMFPLSGGNWGNAGHAGVRALHCLFARGSSTDNVGFRVASYT